MIRVEHIYLSRGHNYFGRTGRVPGTHPMIPVAEVECVAGRGLRGDRFFDYKPDYKGQITFFAAEVYEELCGTLLNSLFPEDFPIPPPSAFRRNVITRGVDLNELIGRQFSIQGLVFSGSAECTACHWMDQGFAPGAHAALAGRGGLRAKIVAGGTLRIDAPAAPTDGPSHAERRIR